MAVHMGKVLRAEKHPQDDGKGLGTAPWPPDGWRDRREEVGLPEPKGQDCPVGAEAVERGAVQRDLGSQRK